MLAKLCSSGEKIKTLLYKQVFQHELKTYFVAGHVLEIRLLVQKPAASKPES